jgi:hypothetical protein
VCRKKQERNLKAIKILKDKCNHIERQNILAKLPWKTSLTICEISGFCHEVDENCALLGYYALSCVNFLLMFEFFTLEDGTDGLSQNVSKKLPLLAA